LERAKGFGRRDVNRGVGKVRNAPDVVVIEVSQQDVLHVSGPKAETFDLTDGGFGWVEDWADHASEPADAARWISDIAESEAGVDEDKPTVGLQQEDMADQGRSGEPHAAAVEVVDLHVE
jgi:hypothetical protein